MRKNSVGVKFLKSTLFFIAGIAVFAIVLPVIFSFFKSIILALPVEVPTNFIMVDYFGMAGLALALLILLRYAQKWMWR